MDIAAAGYFFYYLCLIPSLFDWIWNTALTLTFMVQFFKITI